MKIVSTAIPQLILHIRLPALSTFNCHADSLTKKRRLNLKCWYLYIYCSLVFGCFFPFQCSCCCHSNMYPVFQVVCCGVLCCAVSLADGAKQRCGSDLLNDLLFVCGDRGIYFGKCHPCSAGYSLWTEMQPVKHRKLGLAELSIQILLTS